MRLWLEPLCDCGAGRRKEEAYRSGRWGSLGHLGLRMGWQGLMWKFGRC